MGQVAVIVHSVRSEFSKFFSSSSDKKTPAFYGANWQKRPLTFTGREITGRAGAIMRPHSEWSWAEL